MRAGSDDEKRFTDRDQRRERDRPRLAALAAAEGEHLLDQVARALAGEARLLEILAEPRFAGAASSAASTT